jgi:hypothetical protein
MKICTCSVTIFWRKHRNLNLNFVDSAQNTSDPVSRGNIFLSLACIIMPKIAQDNSSRNTAMKWTLVDDATLVETLKAQKDAWVAWLQTRSWNLQMCRGVRLDTFAR